MGYKLVGLSGLNNTEFLAKGEQILADLKDHPLAQENLHPQFITQQEVEEAFNIFRDLQHASFNKDKVIMAKRDAARIVSEEKFNLFGQQMVIRSDGNAALLLGSGYEVAPPRTSRKSDSAKSLLATINATARHIIVNGQPVPGKILLKWNAVPGRHAYEIQMAEDPSAEENWGHLMHTNTAKGEVEGESAQRRFFRVRVLNGRNYGAWSDVVSILFL